MLVDLGGTWAVLPDPCPAGRFLLHGLFHGFLGMASMALLLSAGSHLAHHDWLHGLRDVALLAKCLAWMLTTSPMERFLARLKSGTTPLAGDERKLTIT